MRVIGLFLPLAVGLLLWSILWVFVFRHLRDLKGQLSLEIREKVLPDLQRSSSQLVTLASASFVLTFTLLQIWGRRPAAAGYLLSAWAGFAFSVLAGIVLNISLYVYRTQCNCVVAELEKADHDGGMPEKARRDRIGRIWRMERFLFALITLQPVAFFVAMLYSLVFAVYNLYGRGGIARFVESDDSIGETVILVILLAAVLCIAAVSIYRRLRRRIIGDGKRGGASAEGRPPQEMAHDGGAPTGQRDRLRRDFHSAGFHLLPQGPQRQRLAKRRAPR